MVTDVPPLLPAVELRSVTYVRGDSGWALDVAFVSDDPGPGPAFDYWTQLYADGALTVPEGEAVKASADGTGTWTQQAAGVELPETGDFWMAVVVRAQQPPFAGTSNGVAIVRAPVTLVGGALDGGHLDITWKPPAGQVNDYRAAITAPGGMVIDRGLGRPGYPGAEPGTQCWRFDLSGVPLDRLDARLKVTVFARCSAGPALATGPGASAPLLTQPPVLAGADTDPVTATTTVAWQPVTGAGSYLVQRYTDGVPDGDAVPVDAAAYTLPEPLHAGSVRGVAVAAVTDHAAPFAGPYTRPLRLPATQPALTHARYDGRRLALAWARAPDVTGYRATVRSQGAVVAAAEAGATATSLEFEPRITASDQDHDVVLQALADAGSGPPSAPLPLARPALVVSADAAATSYPHVVPTWGLEPRARDLVVHLPALGSASGAAHGPFTLARTGDEPPRHTLTVAGDPLVWTFGPADVRSGLRTAYVDFLRAAEKAGVDAPGIAVLQLVLSRLLPQTFAETLYYAYGFDPQGGSFDVRPGMVLRVALADYTSVPPAAPKWVGGYTGGGVVDCEVSSYLDSGGRWRLGFDAVVALLAAHEALEVRPPQTALPSVGESGVADAADLFFPGFREAYFRLFVPNRLEDPSSPGTSETPRQFVLAAAPTFAALQDARSVPTASTWVAYFRGRAVVKPSIRVTVDGTEHVVGIGTTVGGLLDRLARRPPAGAELDGLRLERSLGPAVLDPDAPFDVARSWPVWLGRPAVAAYGPGWDALSLPLLHGDRIVLGPGGAGGSDPPHVPGGAGGSDPPHVPGG